MATLSPIIFKHAELKEEVEKSSRYDVYFPRDFRIIKRVDSLNIIYEPSKPPCNYLSKSGVTKIQLVDMHEPLRNRQCDIYGKLWHDLNRCKDNVWVTELLIENPDKIFWPDFCMHENQEAIDFIMKNPHQIEWVPFSSNPWAIEILSDPNNQEKIRWDVLCLNPAAMDMIEKRFIENPIDNGLNFSKLSRNPSAIEFLMKHPELISFDYLCANPNGIPLIEKMMEQHHFTGYNKYLLAGNPNGLQLFEKLWKEGIISNVDIKGCSYSLYNNESLFELDYVKMSKPRTNTIYYELIEKALSPSRVDKWLKYYIDNGGNIEDFDWI
jgi:hypothetical protein